MPVETTKPVQLMANKYTLAFARNRPERPEENKVGTHAGQVYMIDGILLPANLERDDSFKMIIYCQCCAIAEHGFDQAKKLAASGIPIVVDIDIRHYIKLGKYSKNSITRTKEIFELFHDTVGEVKQYISNSEKGLPPSWYQIITSVEPVSSYIWRVTFNPRYFELSPLLYISVPDRIFGINTRLYPSAFNIAFALCSFVCMNNGDLSKCKISLKTILTFTTIVYKEDAGQRRRERIIVPFIRSLRAAAEAVLGTYTIADKEGKNPVVSIYPGTTKEEANKQWERLSLKVTKEDDLADLYLDFVPNCTLVEFKKKK